MSFEKVTQILSNNDVVLFMKGTPDEPHCGCSAQATAILTESDIPFVFIDVLEDDEIREQLQTYTTVSEVPQLYINGDYVGGCEQLVNLYENDNLRELM